MNHLSGTIPSMFSEKNNLRYLSLKGNKLQGQIPPSLINCRGLEILDFSNNEIDDTFPYFLGSLPELQILVVRSNKLHGLVKGFIANHSFPKLRIFDLSNNMFSGPLPMKYFNELEAMMNWNQPMQYMGEQRFTAYYDYSVSLTLKGLEIELTKIQTMMTTIDFSCNNFSGQIPYSLGKLKSLVYLNLSHNHLTGNIQPSLANLSNLESLDLSWNSLIGRIPAQLGDLTFLEVFSVAHNQLEGPIPQGKQFNTFENGSYEGNLGLCGLPLSKSCDAGDTQPLKQPKFQEEDDAKLFNGFEWRAVVIGYGCGVIFGLSMGYIVFKTRKPAWFVKIVKVERRQKPTRFRKKANTCNGRRN